MYNHIKAQQSKNRVHISYIYIYYILYISVQVIYSLARIIKTELNDDHFTNAIFIFFLCENYRSLIHIPPKFLYKWLE